MWRLAVAYPQGLEREHLVWLLGFGPALIGAPLSDEEIGFLRPHILQHPDLRRLAIVLRDPRFERELHTLAETDDELGEAALLALRSLTIDSESALRARISESRSEPETFLDLVYWYLERNRDPRPLFPMLLDVLQNESADPWAHEMIVELLVELTRRDLGDRPSTWRQFWDDHRSIPYGEWLVGALHDPHGVGHLSTYVAIGLQEPFATGRKALTATLSHPNGRVRAVGAVALARWRDVRAAPTLVRALRTHDSEVRARAFTLLANLNETSLGYDPYAPELDRAQAVGRWAEWAARRLNELPNER